MGKIKGKSVEPVGESMTGVELNPGKDSFPGSRCGSIGKRRGSIVGGSKGAGVVEGTGGISIAGEHLGSQQGKVR